MAAQSPDRGTCAEGRSRSADISSVHSFEAGSDRRMSCVGIGALGAQTGHELRFRVRRALEVQPANRASSRRIRMVDLRDPVRPTRLRELVGAEYARQEAALVADALPFDELDAAEREIVDCETLH